MGSHVLLTGASTGIGHAVLRMLNDDGHVVTTLDVREEVPDGSAEHHQCDLSRPSSIDAVVGGLRGPFDAVLNVAGVAGAMGAEMVLRVNVYGLRHLTESVLAAGLVRSPGGSIVNVASMAGMAWERHIDRVDALERAAEDPVEGDRFAQAFTFGEANAYTLSKEWVIAYTQRLAGRTLAAGIRVNCVSPGPVLTPLFASFEADNGAAQMAWLGEQVGRQAEPDDIAEAICWLAVGSSGWVNGVDLPVDGGLEAALRTGWADTSTSPRERSRT